MKFKNRIKELRLVTASELVGNKKNWRKHPKNQKKVMSGILHEIGYADALIARELPDGKLELIDGHLRAEIVNDAIVPVLVLDVTEQEASTLLATLDHVGSLADIDSNMLNDLIASLEISDVSLREFLNPQKTQESIDAPESIVLKPYQYAHLLLTVPITEIEKLKQFIVTAENENIRYATSSQ